MKVKSLGNEEDLKMQINEGDEKAFATLFYTYKDRLYSFLLGLTHSEAKAEDLLQEVFMKIWQGREELCNIDNMNAYVFRMAQNLAIDHLRKSAREITYLSHTFSSDENVSMDGPAELLMNKELRGLIKDAINHLPPQQRKIFILHRIKGESHEQIAKRLTLSVSTTQNHMRQALNNIRLYLLNHYSEMTFLALFFIDFSQIIKK